MTGLLEASNRCPLRWTVCFARLDNQHNAENASAVGIHKIVQQFRGGMLMEKELAYLGEGGLSAIRRGPVFFLRFVSLGRAKLGQDRSGFSKI